MSCLSNPQPTAPAAKQKRGAKSYFNHDEAVFLEGRVPEYQSIVGAKGDFWDRLMDDLYHTFPYYQAAEAMLHRGEPSPHEGTAPAKKSRKKKSKGEKSKELVITTNLKRVLVLGLPLKEKVRGWMYNHANDGTRSNTSGWEGFTKNLAKMFKKPVRVPNYKFYMGHSDHHAKCQAEFQKQFQVELDRLKQRFPDLEFELDMEMIDSAVMAKEDGVEPGLAAGDVNASTIGTPNAVAGDVSTAVAIGDGSNSVSASAVAAGDASNTIAAGDEANAVRNVGASTALNGSEAGGTADMDVDIDDEDMGEDVEKEVLLKKLVNRTIAIRCSVARTLFNLEPESVQKKIAEENKAEYHRRLEEWGLEDPTAGIDNSSAQKTIRRNSWKSSGQKLMDQISQLTGFKIVCYVGAPPDKDGSEEFPIHAGLGPDDKKWPEFDKEGAKKSMKCFFRFLQACKDDEEKKKQEKGTAFPRSSLSSTFTLDPSASDASSSIPENVASTSTSTSSELPSTTATAASTPSPTIVDDTTSLTGPSEAGTTATNVASSTVPCTPSQSTTLTATRSTPAPPASRSATPAPPQSRSATPAPPQSRSATPAPPQSRSATPTPPSRSATPAPPPSTALAATPSRSAPTPTLSSTTPAPTPSQRTPTSSTSTLTTPQSTPTAARLTTGVTRFSPSTGRRSVSELAMPIRSPTTPRPRRCASESASVRSTPLETIQSRCTPSLLGKRRTAGPVAPSPLRMSVEPMPTSFLGAHNALDEHFDPPASPSISSIIEKQPKTQEERLRQQLLAITNALDRGEPISNSMAVDLQSIQAAIPTLEGGPDRDPFKPKVPSKRPRVALPPSQRKMSARMLARLVEGDSSDIEDFSDGQLPEDEVEDGDDFDGNASFAPSEANRGFLFDDDMDDDGDDPFLSTNAITQSLNDNDDDPMNGFSQHRRVIEEACNDFPEDASWFKTAIDVLCDGESLLEQAVYNECIDALIKLEASYRYKSPRKGLPKRGRPVAVDWWFTQGRACRDLPETMGDMDEFIANYRIWWCNINPEWRPRRDDNTMEHGKDLGDWEELYYPGERGLLVPLMCLRWWYQRDGVEGGSSEWNDAASDMLWVLQCVLKWHQSLPESEDDEDEDQPPKKKSKVAQPSSSLSKPRSTRSATQSSTSSKPRSTRSATQPSTSSKPRSTRSNTQPSEKPKSSTRLSARSLSQPKPASQSSKPKSRSRN
ncbi:hypothetical protein VNI00_019330 [Paramarasmius palmivorus]|uniref:Uncharacterized protein n=1 Tax=Paramarasmius palmivorus TaxID=297713 RepID=A0AAW0AMI1_9AGAR